MLYHTWGNILYGWVVAGAFFFLFLCFCGGLQPLCRGGGALGACGIGEGAAGGRGGVVVGTTGWGWRLKQGKGKAQCD